MAGSVATLILQLMFLGVFALNAVITLIFLVRQICFSIVSIGLPHSNPFSRVQMKEWPTVSVLVAAHNEEQVLAGCLDHLTQLDYPEGSLKVIVVNDRSRDATGSILDSYAARSNGLIRAIHRPDGAVPGKPAALADAFELVSSEVVVFFDADYLPHPPLLKKLIAPFIA